MMALAVLMAFLGHLAHLLKRVVEYRAEGHDIGLWCYVKERKYRTMLGVCGTAAAMAYLIDSGDITLVGAFAAGYIADSGLEIMNGNKKFGEKKDANDNA